ncbi:MULTISPECIES: hypothetical protein [Paenibacillus]|uniref:hypothetical protein n=1 Tax=Paenibacillus TaxID=44249 RepID=UPI0022B87E8A|nr:hypothetical protein [Paenibacillus caseinilyticus]MCZ8520915.1 hypothetical protein [Paenibacillus caseinilyticus]
MNKAVLVVRVLFGIFLLAFAVMSFFIEASVPANYPEAAKQFMAGLTGAGYILFIVTLLKGLVGLSMLTGRFVPLALVLFVPISLNMLLFHLFLEPAGMLPALVLFLMNVFLLFGYLDSYRPLLRAKASKGTGGASLRG